MTVKIVIKLKIVLRAAVSRQMNGSADVGGKTINSRKD
jgi:hypothetical protein